MYIVVLCMIYINYMSFFPTVGDETLATLKPPVQSHVMVTYLFTYLGAYVAATLAL